MKRLLAILFLWWSGYCFKHDRMKIGKRLVCPFCSATEKHRAKRKAVANYDRYWSRVNKALDVYRGGNV